MNIQSGLCSTLLPLQKLKKAEACAPCVRVPQWKPHSAPKWSHLFLWRLWRMARPFEEQSTSIDIKLWKQRGQLCLVYSLCLWKPPQPHACLQVLNLCRHNVGWNLAGQSLTKTRGLIIIPHSNRVWKNLMTKITNCLNLYHFVGVNKAVSVPVSGKIKRG